MARDAEVALGSFILDSEGLSRFMANDREVLRLLREGRAALFDRVVSALTLLEVSQAKINRGHWNYTLSQLRIEPVSEEMVLEAVDLLRTTGLSGHKYAIDAVVAVTAMRQSGPVVMLTSDIDDMTRLCDKRVRLVGL